MTPKYSKKLFIYILSQKVAKEGFQNIKRINEFAKDARKEYDRYIQMVRNAKDADRNWTEEDICKMIIKEIIRKFCKCADGKFKCPVRNLHDE